MNERLKQLREKAGFSQEQLAEQLHVTRQAISKWELGKAEPSIDVLLQLASIYDVTLDYLIKGQELYTPETFVMPKSNFELALDFIQRNTGLTITIFAIFAGLIISLVAIILGT